MLYLCLQSVSVFLSFRYYKAIWRAHLVTSEGYFKSVRIEMNSLIGKLVDFDPAVETWEQYAERLQHFFDANEIQDDSRKRSILLSVLTPKNYKLLRSLLSPEQPRDKSFAQIVEVLQKHHTPSPSEIVQRFKFHSRSRKEGESIAFYVAELRSLAEHCNFGDTLSTMLWDRLVCGVNMDTVQKRLLAESRLTFEDALKIATSMEVATAGA